MRRPPGNQYTTPPLTDRLQRYEPDPSTGCWLWQGHLDDGYGRVSVEGVRVGAHVASWALANGRWPGANEQVRHECDVRRCVNPAHLSIGTHLDNMNDRCRRGRTARGEATGRLTEKNVVEIRQRHAAGESFSALGRALNVHYVTIARAVRGVTWAHLSSQPSTSGGQ